MAARRAGGRRALPPRRRQPRQYGRARASSPASCAAASACRCTRWTSATAPPRRWPRGARDADAGVGLHHPGTVLEEPSVNPPSASGALTLDAEALYRELLRGVKQLLRRPTRAWSASPPAAPGWPSGCRRTWACPARPASSPRPCTATISPARPGRQRADAAAPSTSTAPHILLLDDVLYTGRTIRAVLNELFDFGRPARVQLAVLVDRGGRELPVQADFAAARVDAARRAVAGAGARRTAAASASRSKASEPDHALQAQSPTQQERRADPPAVDRGPAARHRHAHPRHRRPTSSA